MKDAALKKLALEFREGILEGRSSYKMCFLVAWPLEGLLGAYGIEARMVQGILTHIDSGDNECKHCWLELGDGRILDPTADQFKTPDGKSMPEVYLGKKPEWYKEFHGKKM